MRHFFSRFRSAASGIRISTKMMILLSVLILLLAAAMLVINYYGVTRLQTELESFLGFQSQYFHQLLSRDFAKIQARMREISRSEPILRLTYQPNFLSAREIQYNAQWLRREMNLLQELNQLVYSAKIVSPHVSGHAIMSEYPTLFSLPDEHQRTAIQDLDSLNEICTLTDTSHHLYVKYPSGVTSDHIDFILDLQLSNQGIRSALNEFTNENALIVLMNSQGTWFVGNQRWDSENADLSVSLQADLLTDILHSLPAETEISSPRPMTLQGRSYLCFRQPLPDFDWQLLFLYSSDTVGSKLKTGQTAYWYILLITFAVLMVLLLFLRRQIHRPLETLVKGFNEVGQNHLSYRIADDGKNEFSYLYKAFNSTVENLQQSIRQVYEFRLENQAAELKQLQLQINPHFLYNSLFVIYNMAQLEDIDSIREMTRYLGNYYLYVYKISENRVPLSDDFEHAMNYLKIQGMRLGSGLTWETDPVPENWKDAEIPKLTFQPIVENIFKHGFTDNRGSIRISFSVTDNLLSVSFSDSGVGMSDAGLKAMREKLDQPQNASQLGESSLINVHRRLQLTMGPRSGIRLSHSELGGLCVTLLFEMP